MTECDDLRASCRLPACLSDCCTRLLHASVPWHSRCTNAVGCKIGATCPALGEAGNHSQRTPACHLSLQLNRAIRVRDIEFACADMCSSSRAAPHRCVPWPQCAHARAAHVSSVLVLGCSISWKRCQLTHTRSSVSACGCCPWPHCYTRRSPQNHHGTASWRACPLHPTVWAPRTCCNSQGSCLRGASGWCLRAKTRGCVDSALPLCRRGPPSCRMPFSVLASVLPLISIPKCNAFWSVHQNPQSYVSEPCPITLRPRVYSCGRGARCQEPAGVPRTLTCTTSCTN